MTTRPAAVADGLTVHDYDASDVFDCVACHDTGIDADCEGHKVLGRYVFCPCPDCGEGGEGVSGNLYGTQ